MEQADIEAIFAGLGPVTIRRLFSGKGIYHRGLIVGAVMGGEVMLKADALSAPQFLAAGATQWTYEFRRGKIIRMPYWTIPVDAFDDPDLLATWVRLAFSAASRAGAGDHPGTTKSRHRS